MNDPVTIVVRVQTQYEEADSKANARPTVEPDQPDSKRSSRVHRRWKSEQRRFVAENPTSATAAFNQRNDASPV
ncbi:MAG: hypothetical protein H6817_05220 [Phycisphaerales bacterium]|nr:hypothetical protein [Phycisphaerales bacterium]